MAVETLMTGMHPSYVRRDAISTDEFAKGVSVIDGLEKVGFTLVSLNKALSIKIPGYAIPRLLDEGEYLAVFPNSPLDASVVGNDRENIEKFDRGFHQVANFETTAPFILESAEADVYLIDRKPGFYTGIYGSSPIWSAESLQVVNFVPAFRNRRELYERTRWIQEEHGFDARSHDLAIVKLDPEKLTQHDLGRITLGAI